MVSSTGALAPRLAGYAVAQQWDDVPHDVRRHAVRLFVNWAGCAIGGSGHPAVATALAAVRELAGAPVATVLGHAQRLDVAHAALLNGLAASAYAYDDTHLATVAHPTAPAAAALLALAQRERVHGRAFLNALLLAVEVQCRLAIALVVPPGHAHVGLYITGITGAAGVAAGAARLLGLDAWAAAHAIGLGAAHGSGFRATHASMCSGYIPANAGRDGVVSALLAAQGFTCTPHALDGRNGFLDVFGGAVDAAAVTDALGDRFESLAVAAKPYPAGVFVHPAIEACLALAPRGGLAPEAVERVALRVHPLAVALTGKREPEHGYDAQVSVYHWAAAALVHGAAGIEQAADTCVRDRRVQRMRARIEAVPDDRVHGAAAYATMVMADGTMRDANVDPCKGSAANPLSDADLDRKFLEQARTRVDAAAAQRLLQACRDVESADDVGAIARLASLRN